MKAHLLAIIALLALLHFPPAQLASGRELAPNALDRQMGAQSKAAPAAVLPDVSPGVVPVSSFFVDVYATRGDITVPLGRAIQLHNVLVQEGQLPSRVASFSGTIARMPFHAQLSLAVISFQPLAVSLQRFRITLRSSVEAKRTLADVDAADLAVVLIPVPGGRAFSRTATQEVPGIGDVTFTFAGQVQAEEPLGALVPCRSQDLSATAGWQGATGGSLAGSIVFTNESSTTCTLEGRPAIQLVDAGGHTLSVKPAEFLRSTQRVVVVPGARAWARFIWSNWCLAKSQGPITLLVTVPGDDQALQVPVTDKAGTPLGDAPRCDSPGSESIFSIGAFEP